MAANHLDAIIALTNGPAWPTNDDPNLGDLNGHFEYFVGSSTAAACRATPTSRCLPASTRDCRWGSPSSALAGRNRSCSGLAYDFEQATQVRVPPRFIPTIGDALFPGVPNPPAQLQAQRAQATQGLRDRPVRMR
jgi:amidase